LSKRLDVEAPLRAISPAICDQTEGDPDDPLATRARTLPRHPKRLRL
jgi:hypothetical protein